MYNCIQLGRWLPNAADRRGLYPVQLKLLYPGMPLISDARVLFEKHPMQRHINSSYLRFFTQISFGELRAVFAGKTYRHLRFGGITSRAGIVGKQDDVPEAQAGHVFYCCIIEPYHSLTK